MSGHTANTDSATPARLLEGVSIKYSFSAILKVTALWRRRNLAHALIFAIMALLFSAQVARAQEPAAQPLLFPGNAVVTGFSGTTTAYSESDLPENSSVADETFLNTGGASLRVLELERPGEVSEELTPYSPQLFETRSGEIGQVFGVALDDAKLPGDDTLAANIYVTATSAYGLYIVGPDADGDGFPERFKRGGPEAKWMPGLFGLEKGGGPGSIWKIDGVTGEVSLFANIESDGAPNSGPGLGNIAFDPVSRQLFVSDRGTGMIHRLDLQGQDQGSFDHGVDGRPVENLEPVPHDAAKRADIRSGTFRADDPATWGYASLPRRVWGLAIRQGRLYYAVGEGPQIWSVAIKDDGSFGEARWELDLPDDVEPYEVSDITFTGRGRMVLAQRGSVTGAYDYAKPIASGDARVLRYRLESPPRRRTPSRWVAEPDEYAIGQTGDYRNTDGGVAIGYGYTRAGNFNYRACRATLWTSGDRLKQVTRRTLAPRPAAAREEKLFLDGLQGNAATLVRPENVPPTQARFIDFDGAYQALETSGHVGDVEIPIICSPQDPYVPPQDAYVPPQDTDVPPPPGPPPAQAIFDLGLQKSQVGPCSINGICTFEITLTNRGTQTYRGPLVVRDEVSQAGMALVGWGAAPWDCVQSGTQISCRRPELVLRPGRQTSLYVDFQLQAQILIPGWRNCGVIAWLGDPNDPATIQAVQIELANLRFYAGPIDGLMSPSTNQAIADFEIAWGWPATGAVTDQLLDRLFGPGARRAGDSDPANDRDCADVQFIAGPGPGVGPGPGPGQGPFAAALDVTIGGQAECPFGQECSFGLTIRNTQAIPFDQEVDGLVELKRLGVAVPEQITRWPGFCAGPVGQLDVNCRFRLQLGPNEAQSYPLRLNIQNALLDPTNAANRGPDGVVRAEACFAVKDLGWLGGWFAQEFDKDCHSFVVPDAGGVPPALPPGAENLAVEKTGPATCVFGRHCVFEGTIRNTSNAEIRGQFLLMDFIYVSEVDQRLGVPSSSGKFFSMPRAICANGLPNQFCELDFDAQPLAPGEARQFTYTVALAGALMPAADYDPSGEPNRLHEARNCLVIQNQLFGQVLDEGCHNFQIIADDNPPQAGFDLWVNKEKAEEPCVVGGDCAFNVLIGNLGPDAYEGDLVFADKNESNLVLRDYKPSNTWDCQQAANGGTVRCEWTGPRPLRIEPHPFGFAAAVRLIFNVPNNFQDQSVLNGAILDQQIVVADRDASNNLDSIVVPVLQVAAPPAPPPPAQAQGGDLQIFSIGPAKCRAPAGASPSSDCLTDIVLRNNGTLNYSGPLSISVVASGLGEGGGSLFPQNFAGVRPQAWVCTRGAILTCRHEGLNLPVGETQEFRIDYDIPASFRGLRVRSCASLGQMAPGFTEAAGAARANNTSCHFVEIPPDFELKIAASGPAECKLMTECVLPVTVTNIGPRTLNGPLAIGIQTKYYGYQGDLEYEWVAFDISEYQTEPPAGWDALNRNVRKRDVVLPPGESVTLTYKYVFETMADYLDQLEAGVLGGTGLRNLGILHCAVIRYDHMRRPDLSYARDFTEDKACHKFDIIRPNVHLTVTKTGHERCWPGIFCNYQVTITNDSQEEFFGPLRLIEEATVIGMPRNFDPRNINLRVDPGQNVPVGWPVSVHISPYWLVYNQERVRLAVDEEITLPFTVLVTPGQARYVEAPSSAKIKNCARIESALLRRPDDSGKEDCVESRLMSSVAEGVTPLPLQGAPDLKVTKRAVGQCAPARPCRFAVEIENIGTAPYSGPLTISEKITPANANFLASPAAPWSCERPRHPGKLRRTHLERLDLAARAHAQRATGPG